MIKPKNIADQLRQAIAASEKAGTSRADIAKRAGMPRAMLYRIADGRSIPRLDTAERVLKAINKALRIVSN